MKNLYKNEMLRYVSECGNGIVSFVELCMVYKEMNRSLGRKLNNKFIEEYEKKLNEQREEFNMLLKNQQKTLSEEYKYMIDELNEEGQFMNEKDQEVSLKSLKSRFGASFDKLVDAYLQKFPDETYKVQHNYY